MISMSFLGASVKEAYLTLLDLSLVLQNLAYLYIFGALAQIAFRRESNTFLNKWVIRWAAVSGLASTTIGTAVSFVPARQISSVWGFEIKLISICALFLGVAALLFRHYSRQRLRVISGLQ
jgi:hypothetical protein